MTLIERLRYYGYPAYEPFCTTSNEAADEIERLEDMLDHICEASADGYRHSLLNAAKDVGEIERLEGRVAELEGALREICELYYPAEIQRIAEQALKGDNDE